MNTVNPELDLGTGTSAWLGKRKNDPTFKSAVAQLFGRSDNLIVRAVDDFLERHPGTLDHYGLRVIAAAAPHFHDANHVAHLIDTLPITKMNVALAELDLEQAKRHFGQVVPHFSPRTGKKLAMDLIRTSAREVIENSPPERVPPEGRDLVRVHLHKRLDANRLDVVGVLHNPFVSSDVVSKALDKIEASLAEVEEPDWETAAEMLGGLGRICDTSMSEVVSDDDLERAWQLVGHFREARTKVVKSALTNERLLVTHARSMLDLIGDIERNAGTVQDVLIMRGTLLASRFVDEAVACEAVRAGAIVLNGDDLRLACLRQAHYLRTSEPLNVAVTEIDRQLASIALDSAELWADKIEDPEVLMELVDHTDQISPDGVAALIRNPNFDSSHVPKVLDDLELSHCWTRADRHMLRADIAELLSSPKLEDSQLAGLLDKLDRSNSSRVEMIVETALCNSSSGSAVLSKAYQLAGREGGGLLRVLLHTASVTASQYMHDEIARSALNIDDRVLANLLVSNGTIQDSLWQRLTRHSGSVGEVRFSGQVRSHPEGDLPRQTTRPYGVDDVIDLVVSGRAPGDRLRQLPLVLRSDADRTRRLIEAGVVTDEMVTALTSDGDLHLALRYATHPDLLERPSSLLTSAWKRLEVTGQVLANRSADLPAERDARSWSDLPDRRDVLLPKSPLHPLLQSREVNGLELELPSTQRDLAKLAREMGNCIENFTDHISAGTHLVGYARDGSELYAVMWKLSAEPAAEESGPVTASIVEMNSRFNQGRVPDGFRAEVERLTHAINTGTLLPVEVTEPAVDLDEEEIQSTSKPARVVRRQRRSAVPPLVGRVGRVDRVQDRQLEAVAPSVLGASGESASHIEAPMTESADEHQHQNNGDSTYDDIGHDLN